MGAALGAILGQAVNVAISPVPIIAVILMLFSKSAKLNSLSFLAGWVIGLLVVGTIVLASGVTASDGAPSTASGWIKVLIGALFVALGVGVLLSAVNPKNLGLTIVAAATIGGSGLSTSDEYVVLVLFVVVASSTVAAPVLLNLILGSKAAATLTSMKEWLTANNATVMSVLFVVLGANVLGTGLAILV